MSNRDSDGAKDSTRVRHRQLTKPHGALSHTDWLTDALDADVDMELVIYTDDGVESEKIEDTYHGHGDKWIVTESGQEYPSNRINQSERMVIE